MTYTRQPPSMFDWGVIKQSANTTCLIERRIEWYSHKEEGIASSACDTLSYRIRVWAAFIGGSQRRVQDSETEDEGGRETSSIVSFFLFQN